MLNRLVAQNYIKTPFKGNPYFTINKKYIAYALQSSIAIKSIHQGLFEKIIQTSQPILSFELSLTQDYIIIYTISKTLAIYSLQIQNSQILSKSLLTIKNVHEFKNTKEGILLILTNNVVKIIEYSPFGSQQIITQCQSNSKLLKNNGQSIFIRTQGIISIYAKRKNNKYQKISKLDLKEDPIAIYKDRFIFVKVQKQIQIYDISNKKKIGVYNVEGNIKYADIKQNLLFFIANNQNTDYYWFYVLNNSMNDNTSLTISRSSYQKGKSDYYNFINIKKEELTPYIDSKTKNIILTNQFPSQVSQNTISIVFALSKQKQKIEIIKVEHNKILNQIFNQQKLNKSVSNIIENKIMQQQHLQVQTARVNHSLEGKIQDKSFQRIQQKFVEQIIDIKLKTIMKKFSQLQNRVESLENTIKQIYSKLESSIQTINREYMKKNVQNLFSQLTPQFQNYFTQVFKQVSSVLQQGSSYYNYKIAKQAQLHKQVLTKIVTLSLNATEEIIQISKQEAKFSQKTQGYLKQLAKIKKNWYQQTEIFQSRIREMGQVSVGKINPGKVFVKTDLNSFQKRQT